MDAKTQELTICNTEYGLLEEKGALEDNQLVEASGIVAARQSPGVLWSHNDSGDSARLFAFGQDGKAIARLTLNDVQAIDFEDIAAGPCPDLSGPCLWIADTGNNLFDRDELVVYATPEPMLQEGQRFVELHTEKLWRFPIRFPEETKDIEAMLITPQADALYFFEKNDEESAQIFRYSAPFSSNKSAVLETITSFNSPGISLEHGRSITAADMHASASRVLVRVYTGIYEYRREEGQSSDDFWDKFGDIEPELVIAGPIQEPQGEAVAYSLQGSGVWSVSEDTEGKAGQMLHFYRCEAP